MQLRAIEYFLVIAEHLSFNKAAEVLGLSQPALTMQLKALEQDLGVQLFARDRHSVVLTYAGAVFQEEARALLRRVQSAGARTRRAAKGLTETMHIGFISSFATSHSLSTLIGDFSKKHPDVALELKNLSTVAQIALLEKEEIEIGFLRLPIFAPPMLKVVPIHKEPLVLFLPVSHPLAHKEKLSLRDLTASPFILYARHSAPGYYDLIMRILENAGFNPTVGQEVGEIYTMVSLVAGGLGIALGPESAGHYNLPGVVVRHLPELPQVELAVAIHKLNPSEACWDMVEMAAKLGRASGML